MNDTDKLAKDIQSTETFNPATAGDFGICVEAGCMALYHKSFKELNTASISKSGKKISNMEILALALKGDELRSLLSFENDNSVTTGAE